MSPFHRWIEGWRAGAGVCAADPKFGDDEEYARGYREGREAFALAGRAERERRGMPSASTVHPAQHPAICPLCSAPIEVRR